MTDMACNELTEVITAYLDGTLAHADRRRFEAHLAECPFCTEYLEQMRATVTKLGAPDDTMLSAPAREQILAAFRGWRS